MKTWSFLVKYLPDLWKYTQNSVIDGLLKTILYHVWKMKLKLGPEINELSAKLFGEKKPPWKTVSKKNFLEASRIVRLCRKDLIGLSMQLDYC